MPVVVPGLSSDTNISGSASDSAANTQMFDPDAKPASRNRLQDLPEWYKEFTDNLVDTRSTSSGSGGTHPPDPTNQKGSTTHFHTFPGIHLARFASVRKLQELHADAIQKATHSARQSSVTSSPSARRSSMKKENRDTIRGMQSWCKIWPLTGFKVTPCKTDTPRNLRKFLDPEEKQKSDIH